jgi:outer membrane cobalamin receptor
LERGLELKGSEGLGGVIHIITKKPISQRQTSIRGKSSTVDAYGIQGFHFQKINDLVRMIAPGYKDRDGFYMTDRPESFNIKRYFAFIACIFLGYHGIYYAVNSGLIF